MEITIGFISVGALVIINIVVVAFTYGRLTEKVGQYEVRITRLEEPESEDSVCQYHTATMEKLSKIDANQKVVMKKLEL